MTLCSIAQTEDALRQVALSVMSRIINAQIDAGEAPQPLVDKPELLGQVISSVVPGCAVYLMKCRERSGDAVYMKVGIAVDVKKRLLGLQIGCPLIITNAIYFFTASKEEAYSIEQKILKELDAYRVTGEWLHAENEKKRKHIASEYMRVSSDILFGEPMMFSYDSSICGDDIRSIHDYIKRVWELAFARVRIETPEYGTELTAEAMSSAFSAYKRKP
ncbi:MAG: GIY-YIG nuclease family protein [Candidatus Peribacteraceae bacterium]|nr:GIY-YIG nuclease family protein [Candidatus Peribacteraceae bacterium]